MNKNKKIYIVMFSLMLLATAGVFFVSTEKTQAQSFEYEPMEKIPGFESETSTPDLKVWLESLYKFAIWAVGLCALFMITIGGFSYMTSAGNTSKAAVGKGIITDALIGLVLALTAALLFSVINPNLTSVNLQITPVNNSTPSQ